MIVADANCMTYADLLVKLKQHFQNGDVDSNLFDG